MEVDIMEKENGAAVDPRLHAISEAVRVVPHFPKPGIMFNDITTLLLRPKAFKGAIDMFVDRYRDVGISAAAGNPLFSLGFIVVIIDVLCVHVLVCSWMFCVSQMIAVQKGFLDMVVELLDYLDEDRVTLMNSSGYNALHHRGHVGGA